MICPACQHDNIQGADLCADCGMDLAGLDIRAWGVDPDDPLLEVSLATLGLKEPPVLPPEATVHDAIELLRERHEGCVFIVDADGRLAGVFTERDLTTRVAAPGRNPSRMKLSEAMTPQPVTLETDDPLAWALHRMGVDGYRHLPVLEGERLAGFLSARTVIRWLLKG